MEREADTRKAPGAREKFPRIYALKFGACQPHGLNRRHLPETPAGNVFESPNLFAGGLIPAYEPVMIITD